MPSPSNVPALKITGAGVEVPQTNEVLAGVLQDYNDAFGGNLNIENVATPQGVLAADLTKNITDHNAAIAYLVNQIDPATSEGRMQDAIARIYFLYRKGATPTTVEALCTGIAGAILPAGSLAIADDNSIYASTSSATFSVGGIAKVQFAAVEAGPNPLPANSLNRIYQTVSGWDAITNESAGITGAPTESRQDFENRRIQSVAKNAHGSDPAIFGAVADLADVTDCYVISNVTDQTINVGVTNTPLKPHSVYVAAVGGTDLDVATRIWTKKGCGCNTNGNTTVNIEDKSGYVEPFPTYPISFQRPTAVPIKFSVQIQRNTSLPSNIIDLAKQAIISTFTGANGLPRERIAGVVFAGKYYGSISKVSNFVNVLEVLIGKNTADQKKVEIGIDQYPTISESDITVTLV